MAFNPDEYVNSPVSPEEDEEKKKQEASAPKESSGKFDPDAYLSSTPTPETAPEQRDLSAGDWAAGTYGAATGFAKEHPFITGFAKEHPIVTGYAASYIPGLNKLPVIRDIKAGREAVGNIAQRASNFAQNMAGGSPSPVNPTVGTPASPIGAQSTPSASTVPVSGAVAPESVPIQQVPPQAAGMRPAQAMPFSQAARTAAPEASSIMSRVAPYLQTAGKIAAPIARVAGPAGLAMGAYDAGQMARETGLGSRLAGGEAQRAPQAFTGMLNRNVSGYTPNAQEARNILSSGDERTINMYGGRLKLQGLANPGTNAFNSGFAQQLNRLG